MFEAGGRLALTLRRRILPLRLVSSARGAEPALIMALVNSLSPLRRLRSCDAPPQLAHAFVMKRLGRPHEDVVTIMLRVQAELAENLLEFRDDPVCVLFRRLPIALGQTLDVDAVLIRTCQKIGLVATLPVMPPQTVRDYRRIQTAQMRNAVSVKDRSCDVE